VDRIRFKKTNIDAIVPPSTGRATFGDSEVMKLHIRVTSNGAKTYYYVGKHRRKTIWIKIGSHPEISPQIARVKALEYAVAYAKGDDPAADIRQIKDQWSIEKAWQKYRRRHKRRGGKSLETIDGYWRLYFSHWANKSLSDVTVADAKKLRRKILQSRSGATANRVRATGHALYNLVISDDVCTFNGPNPFAKVEKSKETIRKSRLKLSQMPQFFAALDDVSPTMREFTMIALLTGRRAGDIKSMRWVDLDIDGAMWMIPDTKANEAQEVALSDPALEILLDRRKVTQSEWVFPAESRSGHLEEYKKAWQRIRKNAKLGDLRFHDLRRSLSSIAQDRNNSAAVVGAQLGHKDAETTEPPRVFRRLFCLSQAAMADPSNC
jgi:integrase